MSPSERMKGATSGDSRQPRSTRRLIYFLVNGTLIKWPDRIEIVKALPRTPTDKVIKNMLHKEIAEKLQTERASKRASDFEGEQ